MLTPLDALSVATAAVQFVDFTSKLVYRANEIREAGATIDDEYIKDNTVKLISLNAGLRHRRRLIAQNDTQLQFLEAGLDQVLLGCCNIGDELIIILGKLTAPNASIVKSLRTAFLSYLKKEKALKLSKQLDSYRLELSNYSLALINEKLEKQFEDFSTKLERIQDTVTGVQDGQRRINEIIAFSQQLSEPVDSSNEQFTNFEQNLLRRHISEVDLKEGKLDLPLHIQDTEAVTAIIVVSSKKGEQIELQLKSSHEVQSWDRSRPVSIDTTTILRNDGRLTDTGRASVTSFTPVAQSILNSLAFYAYRAREEAIAEAHTRTFQWIFKISPFMDFLRSSDGGCFWVSGKAGSGKSTLMKFIHHHEVIEETLKRWSGKTQLIIASYFFWNAGNELQKSQHGLLRSMLLTILQNQRHLIPVAFPEACVEFIRSGFTATPQFTVSEYKLALTRILSSPLRDFKICYLIDGADEYSGDHGELIDFLEEMMTFPSLKLIISSRPLNIFMDTFGNRPSLSTQDLTKDDIQTYTRDKLTADTHVFNMLKVQPEVATRLVDGITNKAHGVFLWVILVIRSLLSGIHNADSLEDLEHRVDVLPAELDQLYLSMFTLMSPIYRDQAARMFQIMHRSNEVFRQGSLSLLKMWYAMEDTLEISIKAPQKLLAALDRETIYDTMRRRLASRTNGLIEVDTQTTDDFAGSSSIDSSVQFLHQTVIDFLEQQYIRDQIQSYISLRMFDPNVSLLASCIREMKTFPIERAVILNNDRVIANMFNCLQLIRYLEITQRRPYAAALDEVNTVVSNYWNGSKEWKTLASDPTWQLSESVDWPPIALAFRYGHRHQGNSLKMYGLDSFLVLALESECILYVVDKTLGMKITKSQRSAILGEIIFKFFTPGAEDVDEDTVKQRFNLVTASWQIIQQGADPNAKYASEESPKDDLAATPQKDVSHSLISGSIWDHCLFYTSEMCLSNRRGLRSKWDLTAERALQTLQLFQIFISSGADLGHGDLSIGKVLALLEKSLFDPSGRVFRIDVEGKEYKQVRTEYLKTIEVLRQRKAGARVLRELKGIWRKVQPFFCSSFAESFISFVVGGVVVVFITRWLKI